MSQSKAVENLIGSFAPELVELTDRVLFDDVSEQKELSKRDRSRITVAALIALNQPDQLRFHLHKQSRTESRKRNESSSSRILRSMQVGPSP